MFRFWLTASDMPPGFENSPWLYLVSVFCLLMIVMMALEWIWRLAWGMKEHPAPWRHPSTVYRTVIILLMTATLFRIAVPTILLVRWSDMTPETRDQLAAFGSIPSILSLLPFSLAWVLSYLTSTMVFYQLDRLPVPLHLFPTLKQTKRPLKIGLAVFTIAAAITFVR